jgi:putative FmdB family regulatory protein
VPTYQYACTECGHAFDQVQAFTDDALTVCPECTGRLRKVFNAVGVVFKGSGFYRNDSRAKEPSTNGSSSSATSTDSSSTTSDTKTETKVEKKSETKSSDSSAAKTPAASTASTSSSSS